MNRRLAAALALWTAVLLAACSSGDGHAATPFARVTVRNANTAEVLVFGCPYCKSGGGGIPGSPRGQGPSFVAWNVMEPSSLVYPMEIKNGARFLCRPTRAPSSFHGSGIVSITYRITTTGQCRVTAEGRR